MKRTLSFGALLLVACSSNDAAPGEPPSDAGTTPSDARRETFCATRPVLEFCEDFDVAPLPGGFTSRRENAGTLGVDGATSTSPPSSLLAVVPASASVVGRAQITRTFSEGTKLRLFVQLHEQQRSRRAKARVDVLAMGIAGDATYELGIGTDESGAWYGYQRTRGANGAPDTVATFPASGVLAADRWVSVRIDVDIIGAGAATMTVRFGNEAVVNAVKIAPPSASVSPEVRLGLDRAEPPHDGWGFRYDNVTFQVD